MESQRKASTVYEHNTPSGWDHQPRRDFLNGMKEEATRGLVNMSASWCLVSIHWILSCPSSTWERKWWYFKPIWRVWERILGAAASSTQPLLSSKMVEWATVEPTISLVATERSWRRARSVSISEDIRRAMSRCAQSDSYWSQIFQSILKCDIGHSWLISY